MNNNLASIWAKTERNGSGGWHPLVLHMLDVAASAEAVLTREPESTRMRMAACLGMDWGEDARAWLLLMVACHDLGKACPGFQCKWPVLVTLTGLRLPRSPNTEINHAFLSQVALTELLQEKGWPCELAELVADAVGCHHGNRASPTTLNRLGGDERAIGRNDWAQARRGILEALLTVFNPSRIPTKPTLSGPDFMLLSGLTSFADWIGSNQDWFPFKTPEDCAHLPSWFQRRRANVCQAMDTIGWEPRTPLVTELKSFDQVFGIAPRPLQQAVAEVLADMKEPAILLVEAPMGEGVPGWYGPL
jgi:CRISPR-associated endonuclease/helicase Cas3